MREPLTAMHAFPPPLLPPPPTDPATGPRLASSAAGLGGDGGPDGNPSPTRQLSPPPPGPPPHHHGQGHGYAGHQQPLPAAQQHQARSVKRPRPVKSCTECRKRKLRCDRLLPCSQCQKSARACRYAADQDSTNLSDGSDVDAPDPSRPPKRRCPSVSSGPAKNDAAAATATAVVVQTPAKNGESPGRPLLEELSLRMERLERQVRVRSPGVDLGGRAMAASPSTTMGLTVKRGAQCTRFFGQNSTRVLLNLFDDAKALLSHQRGDSDLFHCLRALHRSLQDALHRAMAPITVFVDSMMPVHKRMTDILPNKAVCDRLVASYLNTSETIYRILHAPTFFEQYELFWEGKLQSESFLPRLLSVLSIASRFETQSKGLGHERVDGVHMPTACALVRTWLDGLQGKRLVELTTLQVELLLLLAQRVMKPRAEDAWTQLGFVVRLAMTMGLHRDPSAFGPRIGVFLGELRRRLWFTIVDMDLHLSLACNLPCLLREGDFSCRPPRNLDDADLFVAMDELPPAKPLDQATDNQVQVYAAMTLGARMRVAPLVNRVDSMRDYREVVEVGAKLERFLDDINHVFPRHGLVDDSHKSRQWRRRVVLDMHVRRPLLALYRPLAMEVADAPPQISRAYLKSSMVILKYLDELDPRLAHFDDMADMYHQILKRDMMQAALSVCFYIRSAVRPDAGGPVLGQQAPRASPAGSDDYPSYRAEQPALWSPARLIHTVQKTLDLLVANISGGDTKDIVCIALVLETVKSPEPRPHEVTRRLHGVLDACLRAADLTRDEAHALTAADYGHGRPSHGRGGGGGSRSPAGGDFGGWVMWEGWD